MKTTCVAMFLLVVIGCVEVDGQVMPRYRVSSMCYFLVTEDDFCYITCETYSPSVTSITWYRGNQRIYVSKQRCSEVYNLPADHVSSCEESKFRINITTVRFDRDNGVRWKCMDDRGLHVSNILTMGVRYVRGPYILTSCDNPVEGRPCLMTCETRDPYVFAITWIRGTTTFNVIRKLCNKVYGFPQQYAAGCSKTQFWIYIKSVSYERDKHTWQCMALFGSNPSNTVTLDITG